MLTDEIVTVAGPDLALRADAASVSLLLHPDTDRLAVVDVADFFADWNLLTGGAIVAKRLILIVVLCHKIFSFRRIGRSGDNLYGCQFFCTIDGYLMRISPLRFGAQPFVSWHAI